MFLAPGVLIVIGAARRIGFCDAITKGFLVSFAVVSVLGLASGWTSTRPSLAFVTSLMAVTACAWVWCVQRGGMLESPAESKRRLLWLVGLSSFAVAVSVPIVFWQDLNSDGGEALTMARSLDQFLIPRVPRGYLSGLGLGMVAEAYWSHAFYLLGGLTESAVRLPFVFFLPVLFLGAISVIETDSPRRLRPREEVVLALGIVVTFVALAYNSSYHAYSADMSSPAAIDVFAGICMLGMLKAFADRQVAWALAFAAVGYFARPIAPLICGLCIVAQLVVAPRDWRKVVPIGLGVIACCGVLALLYEKGVASWLDLPLVEPSTGVTGRRLRYLLFSDWPKLAYVAVPAGFLPAASLLLFPLQDRLARTLACTALLYGAFFYCLAFTAIHQYLPAVLLSLVVFWRIVLGRPRPFAWTIGGVSTALVALGLSLPSSFALDRSNRSIGPDVDFRIGDYANGWQGFSQAFAARALVLAIFPDDTGSDPARQFVGTPLLFMHYATIGAPDRDANYLFLPPGQTAAAPWFRAAENAAGSVWVKDRAEWQRRLGDAPPTTFRSRILSRPRESLLPTWGLPVKRYDVDVKELLSQWVPRKDASR